MAKCEWSNPLGLCKVMVIKGTDTKVSCDGRHSACSSSRHLNIEDIRFRNQDPENEREVKTMVREVTIDLATIQSTRSKYASDTGRLVTTIQIETFLPPVAIAELLALQATGSPLHLVITSHQSELPLGAEGET